jgi:ABC-2 type transport system permease protein
MIAPLVRVALIQLRRDRVALALTFVLPIFFFSIFAVIFGGMGGASGLPAVEVVVVDEDRSVGSARLAAAIVAEPGFTGPGDDHPRPLSLDDREQARRWVREGECDVAVVLPSGIGAALGSFDPAAPPVTIYADTVANPVAHQVVDGLLQKVATVGMPDLMMERGLELFERHAGALTGEQRSAVDALLPQLGSASAPAVGATREETPGSALTPLGVVIEDVGRVDESISRRQRMVAFQAAGIGVMFLLFSVVAAANSLLQEEETGTLDRLLNAGVGIGRLLTAYWIWATLMGSAQVSLMFVWGWAVFGLDLWSPEHLAGFAVMTAATASAASAFGLALGTACRSRAQLSGLSTIVILAMSALGGSMVPRFILRANPLLDKLGLLTFNAWAIDGFQKVFWYETGLASLWPQVTVLLLVTVVSLAIARRLARRWEAV